MGHETEEELVAMIIGDEPQDTIEVETDRRLLVKPAPRDVILDLDESIALNDWLVEHHKGRRHRGGRLVTLDGKR